MDNKSWRQRRHLLCRIAWNHFGRSFEWLTIKTFRTLWTLIPLVYKPGLCRSHTLPYTLGKSVWSSKFKPNFKVRCYRPVGAWSILSSVEVLLYVWDGSKQRCEESKLKTNFILKLLLSHFEIDIFRLSLLNNRELGKISAAGVHRDWAVFSQHIFIAFFFSRHRHLCAYNLVSIIFFILISMIYPSLPVSQ